MTNCCHCSGVTPPPPPPVGACCFWDFDISFSEKQCEDGVEISDCESRLGGISYPSQECSDGPCDIIPTCFTSESLVSMADGSFKKISEVYIGEEVKSIDNQVNTVTYIEKTTLGSRKLSSINNSDFFFSYDHPILTNDGFKSLDVELSRKLYSDIDFVGELGVGDIIFTENGEKLVEDIKLQDPESSYDIPLYDLTLDGNHIYFVNDIAFHNCTYRFPCCQKTETCASWDGDNLIVPPCDEPLAFIEVCSDCTSTTTSTTTTSTTTTSTTSTTTTAEPPDPGCCYDEFGDVVCQDIHPDLCLNLGGTVLDEACDQIVDPCAITTTTTTTTTTIQPTTTTTTTLSPCDCIKEPPCDGRAIDCPTGDGDYVSLFNIGGILAGANETICCKNLATLEISGPHACDEGCCCNCGDLSVMVDCPTTTTTTTAEPCGAENRCLHECIGGVWVEVENTCGDCGGCACDPEDMYVSNPCVEGAMGSVSCGTDSNCCTSIGADSPPCDTNCDTGALICCTPSGGEMVIDNYSTNCCACCPDGTTLKTGDTCGGGYGGGGGGYT